MRFVFLFLFLLVGFDCFSITATIPTGGSTGGLFANFRTIMQFFLNFIANDVAFFSAMVLTISGVIMYKLDPRSGLTKTIMEYGGLIIGLFWIFTLISYIYNLFA